MPGETAIVMSDDADVTSGLLRALSFAAQKHRDQRRKGGEASPYINHPIEVARALAEDGGVSDLVTLQAALLHDTIEDTDTTPEELERAFGAEVRRVVEEVTDDQSIDDKAARKRIQASRAPRLSERAKLVRIGDKIANVRDVSYAPPSRWSLERRREYVDWTREVVDGCRGVNAALEARYDRELERALRVLDALEA